MKKLLILLLAAGLFTSCNNNKGKNNENTSNREKDDYTKRDSSSGDKDKTNDDGTKEHSKNDPADNNNANDSDSDKGGWSISDEDRFLDDCTGTATENVGATRAKQYCNCMLLKIKRMYSTYAEAERKLTTMSQEQINELAVDCNR